MNNVEKLKEIGILEDVRLRMGAEDSTSDKVDHLINEMGNHELIAEWCGWKLGHDSWWNKMKSMFDYLEVLDKQ